jgi:hypothetical protein
MTQIRQAGREHRTGEAAPPRLEDLVPIAVVIAAGCERCAESAVRRALRNGSARPLVERTLGIVERLCSTDCFVQAVGAEVIARMAQPLQAGRRATQEAAAARPGQACCG